MFRSVFTMKEYLNCIGVEDHLSGALEKDDDTENFKAFLATVLVCGDDIAPVDVSRWHYSQCQSLADLIMSVIETMFRKEKPGDNLLTLGFTKVSPVSASNVQIVSGLEHLYPSSNITVLQSTNWQLFYTRVGEDAVRHMLKTKSIFIPLSGTNSFIQITGKPAYLLKRNSCPNIAMLPPRKERCVVKRKMMCNNSSQNVKRLRLQMHESASAPVKVVNERHLPHPRTRRGKRGQGKNKKHDCNPQLNQYHYVLSRKAMFCSKSSAERLPRKYILDCLTTTAEYLTLTRDIFSVRQEHLNDIGSSAHHRQCNNVSAAVWAEMCTSVETIVKNHSKCAYKQLLEYYCPTTFKELEVEPPKCLKYSRTASPRTKSLKAEPCKHLNSFATYDQVYLCMRAICIRVIPHYIWGCSHNRNVFFKALRLSINLGRHEKLYIGSIMENIKVEDMLWLKDIECKQTKMIYITSFMKWILQDYIYVIIRCYFYITDTAVGKHQLFYYRKSVWKMIREYGVSVYAQKRVLVPILKGRLQDFSALGVANLRFMPKSKDVRPISNFGPKTIKASINSQLIPVFDFLTWITTAHPALLGSSVFSREGIYSRLKAFMLQIKPKTNQRLYFVKVDIQHCFDSMQPRIVYNIVLELLENYCANTEFVLRRYVAITKSDNTCTSKHHRQMTEMKTFKPKFAQFCKEICESKNLQNCVFIEKMLQLEENQQEILTKLNKLLFHNVIQIGEKHYHQEQGISQGSIISNLLCALYYAKMESEFLQYSADGSTSTNELPEHVYMGTDFVSFRQQDDFLLITSDIQRAVHFAQTLMIGIPKYNCVVNPCKTLTNFEVPGFKADVMKAELVWFPWCGLLLNTRNLSVMQDYTRYAGVDIRYSMTYDVGYKSGNMLANKMKRWMRPNLNKIFLDTQLNDKQTVVCHLHKTFCLAACRLHACHRRLPYKHRANDNPRFFRRTICGLARYVTYYVTKRLQLTNTNVYSSNVVEWLCIHTFIQILGQHHALYYKLLRLLQKIHQTLELDIDTEVLQIIKTVSGDLNKVPQEFHSVHR